MIPDSTEATRSAKDFGSPGDCFWISPKCAAGATEFLDPILGHTTRIWSPGVQIGARTSRARCIARWLPGVHAVRFKNRTDGDVQVQSTRSLRAASPLVASVTRTVPRRCWARPATIAVTWYGEGELGVRIHVCPRASRGGTVEYSGPWPTRLMVDCSHGTAVGILIGSRWWRRCRVSGRGGQHAICGGCSKAI